MMKAIPLALLPDLMTVRVPSSGDWGGAYGSAVAVACVRFDSVSSLSPNQYRLSDGSKGLIFVDAVNSVGAFDIPEASIVNINGGDDMQVIKATALKTVNGAVHHWELEVR